MNKRTYGVGQKVKAPNSALCSELIYLSYLQVRLQLETLLAEKQRLQQENANYARENQFLHEVVEYHQIEFNEDALSGDCHELGLIQGDEEVDQMMSMNLSQEDMAAGNSQMT